MTSGIALPMEEIRRAKMRRRLARLIDEGVPADKAVHICAILEAADKQSKKKRREAERIAGTELVRPAPARVFRDTAVDRLAKRIKDFIQSRSSEQAHRIAVDTAQQTEREDRARR